MRDIFTIIFIVSLPFNLALAQPEIQKKWQTQLIMAEDGETITLEAGTFYLSKSLSLESKKNITIKGQGMNKTILSFKGQSEGAEGIKVSNAKNILIQDLTVQDTKGDGIKTMNVEGISFQNVKTEWTGKPDKNNGAYGIYPVSCSNVLIDGCMAVGASDAGIYVGQSRYIIVRNSKAYHNVAGIEIENSLYADVYDNEVYNNTGGILVFDLPDLVQKKGGYVRVFNNIIRENNYLNFAPKGNIVAKVPDGTGLMILATNHVEVFNNKILKNNSLGTAIISYFMTENPIKDTLYDPYPTAIYIYDNEYRRDPVKPTMRGRLGKMFHFKLKFGKKVPDIIYDGVVDPKSKNPDGSMKTESQVCIRKNIGATFANIDAENDFKNISKDLAKHNCELKNLEETKLQRAGSK